MSFLKAKDTISGQEGRAYGIINGRNEEMFFVKKLEAKLEKEKTDIKTLGRRGTQHKATGWSGSGSMTIYYVTSLFRQMMLDYINKGIDTYFDIQIVNEDPTSSIGKQTIILNDVNLNGVVIAMLDTGSDALEEDIDFTFEGVTMQDQFKAPTLG
ncbi:phage portal protein [Paenibacillus selenitireducens]|uniref:Phage portal protein n=1 Tax=Paenibacillus selenitireducens TaxID=1324314 RepID=A0A1T2X9Y2_9BACL|nr:phage tail tube protein [Paenibacillus selenitireducens]OPA76622.1 phage portal protein [Paenibacillus selenitireducens]